jgi:hypothetical protein
VATIEKNLLTCWKEALLLHWKHSKKQICWLIIF